jgi:uncharacterized protein (DUF1800 family)
VGRHSSAPLGGEPQTDQTSTTAPASATAPAGTAPIGTDTLVEDVGPAARHRSGPSAPSRRRIFGLIGTGAVVSACGAKVAPEGVKAAISPVTGALGIGRDQSVSRAKQARVAKMSSGGMTGGAMKAGALGPNSMGATSNAPRQASQGAAGYRAPAASPAPGLVQPKTPLALDQTMHLARRATWGPTPQVVSAIRSTGATAWIDQQLKPASIADPVADGLLKPFDTLSLAPEQLQGMNKEREKKDYFYAHTQLEQAAMVRAVWSNRQLLEVMVDFHHSRLHVPGHFDKSRDSLNHYDINVVRKYAFGKFSDMVWAMVTHPAMIVYLDNHTNTKAGGNQNLGRELLELHTLGVGAGYTQADVDGAAKILTGLSVTEKMTMVYNPDQHHLGAVKVYGRTYANSSAAGGLATIKALVRDLTHNKKTAEYFALDLCRRFVSDTPSSALVKRLAATYLKYDTAIAPVLRQLLTSAEFKASVGQKYRRPFESAAATARVLALKTAPDPEKVDESLRNLNYTLTSMGQSPLGRNSPDGYPDFARPWLSSVGVLARWNMQMSFTGGWLDGFTKPDVEKVLAKAKTYGEAVDLLMSWLLMQKGTTAQKATLLKFLGKSSGTALTAENRKNDYNLRVRVPALILGGPQHQLR